MRHLILIVLTTVAVFAAPTRAAHVILNEYNAVGGTSFLEDDGEDTYWGRIAGNGGDWFELAVINDHLDMRGWRLVMHDSSGSPDITLTLTMDTIWSDLRSGTIITISEDLANNVEDYIPALGGWWLNVKAADDTSGTYITASNFRVSNDNWQLTIRNQVGTVVFGPAGEGIQPPSGVSGTEVCKLEANPSASITPQSAYNDGASSTFGSPNAWSGGTFVQDFSALRAVLPYHPLTTVRINEVLTHTDLPSVDWVELCNTTDGPVDVSGWFLSDDLDILTAFSIPDGTIIPANDFVAFDESELGFALDSAHGDEVILSEADAGGVMTGGRDYLGFGALDNGVSFGRYPDGVGRSYRLIQPTQEARNAEPLVGPIVINEIMYHPPDLAGGVDNEDHEFIEVHNITDDAVNLFTYFPSADETHPWRLGNAIEFSFATDTVVPAHGFLLVVGFDPEVETATLADFLLTYSLDASTPIVGPYDGKLSNSGESLTLRRPDTPQPPGSPDEGFVPYVLIDEAPYRDADPWPTEPNGGGYALERIEPTGVGDVPANWRASATLGGTPGAVNSCPLDGNHDGDGDVDLIDFGHFVECLSGPNGGLNHPRCGCFDRDADGDVDLLDFAVFSRDYTG